LYDDIGLDQIEAVVGVGGTVFQSSARGGLIALDPSDLHLLWSGPYRLPSVAPNGVIFALQYLSEPASQVVGLEPGSGTKLWEFRQNEDLLPTLLDHDGNLYCDVPASSGASPGLVLISPAGSPLFRTVQFHYPYLEIGDVLLTSIGFVDRHRGAFLGARPTCGTDGSYVSADEKGRLRCEVTVPNPATPFQPLSSIQTVSVPTGTVMWAVPGGHFGAGGWAERLDGSAVFARDSEVFSIDANGNRTMLGMLPPGLIAYSAEPTLDVDGILYVPVDTESPLGYGSQVAALDPNGELLWLVSIDDGNNRTFRHNLVIGAYGTLFLQTCERVGQNLNSVPTCRIDALAP
jgi:outer membrane protein assembly factor BamB